MRSFADSDKTTKIKLEVDLLNDKPRRSIKTESMTYIKSKKKKKDKDERHQEDSEASDKISEPNNGMKNK